MTHTSTEQPEALRLADLCAADWDLVRPHLVVQMLRDLHARVQELEAHQSQRVPLTDEHIADLQEKYVGVPCPSYPLDASDWINFARAIERAHGITQEKQG